MILPGLGRWGGAFHPLNAILLKKSGRPYRRPDPPAEGAGKSRARAISPAAGV